MNFRTRFAPSPTGPLHLGHAYSAILAHDMAMAAGGELLLRIEDIDQSRSRPEWEAQIYEDLRWLGLTWEEPVMRQSGRAAAYRDALQSLWGANLLYPCTCTRRDILDAISAPQEGNMLSGPDGLIYPGICRSVVNDAGAPHASKPLPEHAALRLNLEIALSRISEKSADGPVLRFEETGSSPDGYRGVIEFSVEALLSEVGDVVLARRDMGTSYHLSVAVDDTAQGITHVVRGQDLFEATKIHVVLQKLLDLPTPVYHHHRLIRDETGKRLAKRDDARAIRKYRDEGATAEDVRNLVGL